jgi:hypothetical protein
LEIETVSNNKKFRFVDSQIPISTDSNIHFVRLDYVNYTSSESMNQIVQVIRIVLDLDSNTVDWVTVYFQTGTLS